MGNSNRQRPSRGIPSLTIPEQVGLPWPGAAAACARALAALVLAATPARAFDLDPGPGMHTGASFRGSEIGVRDYQYGSDAFMTIFSYFHGLEDRLLYEREPTGLRATVGSVDSNDFYIDLAGRLSFTFEERFTLRYRVIQDEDLDSRYLRNVIEGEVDLAAGFFVALGSELNQEKAVIDVSGGVGWRGKGGWLARVDYVATDMFSSKADGYEYEDQPGSILGRFAVPISGAVTATAWAATTPHFRLDAPAGAFGEDEPFRFDFEKHKVGSRVDADLGAAGRIGFRSEFERMRKATVLTGPPNPNAGPDDSFTTVAVERELFLAEALHAIPLRGGKDELEWGLYSIVLDEPNDFADDTRDERIRTWQLFGKLRYAWRPLEALPWMRLSPALYAGWVDNQTAPLSSVGPTKREREVQAKLNLAITISSEKVRIVLNPTFRLDDPQFGGGNVQMVLTF
jgi:hypothetical protein